MNIQNAEAINRFDIIAITNPAVLQPISNDLTGFLFQGHPNLVASNTVNPAAGTSQVAAVLLGALTAPPTTRRLFATTYNVVGSGNSVVLGFQQAILTNPSPVTVTVQTPTFSSLGDFSISTAQTSLSVPRGSSVATSITLTSIGRFEGNVALTVTVSPVRKNGPTAGLIQTTISLTVDASASSTLSIMTARNAFKGSYTITVTGNVGSLSHSVTISLTVTH